MMKRNKYKYACLFAAGAVAFAFAIASKPAAKRFNAEESYVVFNNNSLISVEESGDVASWQYGLPNENLDVDSSHVEYTFDIEKYDANTFKISIYYVILNSFYFSTAREYSSDYLYSSATFSSEQIQGFGSKKVVYVNSQKNFRMWLGYEISENEGENPSYSLVYTLYAGAFNAGEDVRYVVGQSYVLGKARAEGVTGIFEGSDFMQNLDSYSAPALNHLRRACPIVDISPRDKWNTLISYGQSNYDRGYTNGYDDGYKEAEDTDANTNSIFSGIIDVGLLPINMFLDIFNFQLFGINFRNVVSGLLTALIAIILVRMFTGN